MDLKGTWDRGGFGPKATAAGVDPASGAASGREAVPANHVRQRWEWSLYWRGLYNEGYESGYDGSGGKGEDSSGNPGERCSANHAQSLRLTDDLPHDSISSRPPGRRFATRIAPTSTGIISHDICT